MITRWLKLAALVLAAACSPPTTEVPDAGQPDSGTADPCVADAGCWTCAPTAAKHFLNQCSGSTCSKFDNGRLPRLNSDGSLPPLQ